MELVELMEMHYCIERIVSNGYRASILNAIATWQMMIGRRPTVGDFSDDALNALASWMLRKEKARPTVNRVVRTLCALARFARRPMKLTTYRPDVSRLKESLPPPTCRSLADFNLAMKYVRKLYGESYWGLTLEAVLLVNYDTALRVGDITRLQTAECELAAGIVRVVERKTGKARAFKVSIQAADAIMRARQASVTASRHRPQLIPYFCQSEQPLRRRFRRALIAAGLPNDRRSLFQNVRRQTITAAKGAGMDPVDVAGHSAKWVTDTYYVAVDQLPPLDVASRIPRPMVG